MNQFPLYKQKYYRFCRHGIEFQGPLNLILKFVDPYKVHRYYIMKQTAGKWKEVSLKYL